MSDAHSWRGVLGHLAFVTNNSGSNGLATWGVEDTYHWDFPFLNRRSVEFDYDGAASSGGTAWEGEVPGPALGLPPAVSVKIYVHETLPDVGFVVAGELELSFEKLILDFGLRVLLNEHVQRVARNHLSTLRMMFDKLAENAPSITIAGALGLSLGTAMDTMTPYIRFLTTAEMNFNPGIFEATDLTSAVSRVTQIHEIDMTGGRLGGRSWQISSLANIPTRF